MKTVEQAHAAGQRDGKAGLGPLAPRNGPPGSLAHRLHAAYMQSYRDALVARVGVSSPPRGRNRRPRRKARARRAPRRRAPRGKTVTTVSQSKVIRRTTNPRPLYVLYACKRQARLKYLGHGKFGTRGRAVMFQTVAEGNAVGRALVQAFPAVLRGWTVKAGEDTPPAGAPPARRRFEAETQSKDPAEALYREKVRQDTEAAHRWLARQKK